MSNIILCGNMGTGKSVTADILKKNYGYREVALGEMVKVLTHSLQRAVLKGHGDTYIKQLSLAFLGANDPAFTEKVRNVADCLAEQGPTKNKGLLRFAYQQIGTEVVRTHVPEAWIIFAKQRARTLNNQGFPVVISDVRFPNEFTAFTQLGYIPIKVTAPLELRVQWLKKRDANFDPANLSHTSETFTFNCPALNNNGTIKDLEEAVANIFITQEPIAKIS